MGFRIIFFLLFFSITGVLIIQNSQNITLIFLGSISFTFPLSLWLVIAFFAGIVSSFLIQILTYSPSNKSTYSSNNNYSNSPPSPPQSPSSIKNKPVEQDFQEKPEYKSFNQEKDINEDFDFDFEEELKPDNETIYNPEVPENKEKITINEPEISPSLQEINKEKTEETLQENTSSFSEEELITEIPPEKVNPVDNTPSATFTKPREASLYSYQPREKTEIIPKSIKQKSANSTTTENTPRSNSNKREIEKVYDVPYRVISPSYDDVSIEEEFFDEEEDWDF